MKYQKNEGFSSRLEFIVQLYIPLLEYFLEAVNETRLAHQHAPVDPYSMFWLFVSLESLSLHLMLHLNIFCCNFNS